MATVLVEEWHRCISGDFCCRVLSAPRHIYLAHVQVQYTLSHYRCHFCRSVDLANYQVDISVDLPYLTFSGAYEVSGRLLFLPLKGKGPVKANASEYEQQQLPSHCPCFGVDHRGHNSAAVWTGRIQP
jgi:hypothetical protein